MKTMMYCFILPWKAFTNEKTQEYIEQKEKNTECDSFKNQQHKLCVFVCIHVYMYVYIILVIAKI